MARTLNEVIAALPASDRAKIEARAAVLIAEEMSLRQLQSVLPEKRTVEELESAPSGSGQYQGDQPN